MIPVRQQVKRLLAGIWQIKTKSEQGKGIPSQKSSASVEKDFKYGGSKIRSGDYEIKSQHNGLCGKE